MDMHHIRYFLAVAETLNFTRAAELCNVTQPALSRSIQQLEDEIGGLLFRRERHRTHLTDLGMLLRPRFEQVMADLSHARRDAEQFLTLEKANCTVGVMCTIGPVRFTSVLAHFKMSHPGITLCLIEGTPPRLTERLEAGEIDVALMAQSEDFPERFDVRHLYDERFLVSLPTGHRLAGRPEVRIADLDGENYLQRLNCEYANYIDGCLHEQSCNVMTVYESEREDWILNMVAAGLGITLVPEFSATAPGIEARPIVDPVLMREVCLVSMSGRRQSPAVASFVKAVSQYRWPESPRTKPRAA